jgi:integrase
MAKRRAHGEGSITPVAGGKKFMVRWRVSLPDGSRKRMTAYEPTRKAAAARLAEEVAKANKGLVYDEDTTLAEFLRTWLKSIESTVKPGTLATYEAQVRARIEPNLGCRKLTKLSAAQLTAFYGRLLDQGLSPATARLNHAIIHRALSKAQKWGMIPANAASVATAPKPRSAEVTPLTQEQARTLLAASAGTELEALWVLLVSSGVRIVEALATRWEDVDLTKGVLRVSRTLSWEHGDRPRFGSPKGGKGRSIHLSQRATDALRRHSTRQKEQRLAAPVWEEHGLALTTEVGRPLRREAVARNHFRPLLVRAALPPTTRLHDLRHTCATLLLAQGTHPTLVQHLLGHSSVSMTLDKYSHWVPSMGEQTAQAIESALG